MEIKLNKEELEMVLCALSKMDKYDKEENYKQVYFTILEQVKDELKDN